jgi:outer membrane murein-binding lipoprotein Lpp
MKKQLAVYLFVLLLGCSSFKTFSDLSPVIEKLDSISSSVFELSGSVAVLDSMVSAIKPDTTIQFGDTTFYIYNTYSTEDLPHLAFVSYKDSFVVVPVYRDSIVLCPDTSYGYRELSYFREVFEDWYITQISMYGVDPDPPRIIMDYFSKKIDISIDTIFVPIFVDSDFLPITSFDCQEGYRVLLRWPSICSDDFAGYIVYSGHFPGIYTSTYTCTENEFVSDPIFEDTYFTLAFYYSSGNVSHISPGITIYCVPCDTTN